MVTKALFMIYGAYERAGRDIFTTNSPVQNSYLDFLNQHKTSVNREMHFLPHASNICTHDSSESSPENNV